MIGSYASHYTLIVINDRSCVIKEAGIQNSLTYKDRQQISIMQEKRYPKGYFVATGMVLGLPLGIPIGLVLGMVALGPGIGIALGAGIGVLLEKKYNPDPLLMSPEENAQRKKVLLALAGIFLLCLIMFFALLIIT